MCVDMLLTYILVNERAELARLAQLAEIVVVSSLGSMGSVPIRKVVIIFGVEFLSLIPMYVHQISRPSHHR